MTNISISTEFIKLDSFLKYCQVADTGGFAKAIIKDGFVLVNGIVALERGKKIRPGDTVEVRIPSDDDDSDEVTSFEFIVTKE